MQHLQHDYTFWLTMQFMEMFGPVIMESEYMAVFEEVYDLVFKALGDYTAMNHRQLSPSPN